MPKYMTWNDLKKRISEMSEEELRYGIWVQVEFGGEPYTVPMKEVDDDGLVIVPFSEEEHDEFCAENAAMEDAEDDDEE